MFPARSSSLLSFCTAGDGRVDVGDKLNRETHTHVSLDGKMIGGDDVMLMMLAVSFGSVFTGDSRRAVGPACTSVDGMYAEWAGETFDVPCRDVKKKSCRHRT